MKIKRLDEGKWFDVLTTNKEPKKKDVVFSQDGFDVLRDKTKKGTFYSVYKDGYEVKLLPTVNNKDQDNVVNFLKNELYKGTGYSDWIRGINSMKDNIKGLSKRQVKKYLTASLTNEYFYRLEIGKDNISLGGIFTQIQKVLDKFYNGDNEFEYDVAEDLDKNMFEMEEKLAVPDVNWKGYDSELVRCAFTKEGYDKFKENIDNIKGDLEDLGYKLIIKRVQPDEESIFFRDDLQIVYYDDIANVEPLDEKFDFYETFINKMDKDVLDIIKTQPSQNKYAYNGKCSKSSGVNLVTAYNDPNTTDIYLVLGGLVHEDNKDKYKVGQDILHMWVEIDGEVIATNEPKDFVRVEKDRLKIDKTKDLYTQVEQFLSKHSVKETLYQDEKVKDKNGRDFRIWTECTGGYDGQEDYMKIAYLGDNWMDDNDRVIRDNLLGILEYAVDEDNKCYVQMIQVKDTEQHKGIATALIKSLQNEYKDIDFGYTTNDGTKLLKSLGIRESVQNYGYHAGDLGKSERREQQTGGRGTGHFGTGTYFVGNPDKIKNYNDYQYGKGKAPHHIVDFSSYHLYKPSNNYMGYKLHDALKELNNGYRYYTQYANDYDWFISKGIDANHTDFEISEIPEIVSHLNNLLFEYDKIELPSDIDWDTIEDEYTQEDDRLTTELKPQYKDENGYTEWGKLIDTVETELNKNPKFKEKNDTVYKVLDAISNELGERDLDKYRDIKRLPDKLYEALERRHSKEEITKALEEVNKHLGDKTGDSLSTIFMKALGYDGVDVRHLNKDGNGWAGLDNTTYGSVIYDVKPETIVEELLTEMPKYKGLKKVNDDEWVYKDTVKIGYNKTGKYYFVIEPDSLNWMYASTLNDLILSLDEELQGNLNEDLSQEVDSEGNPLTKEQVEFFKNSKVRDSRGRLLVCYHSTNKEFDEFKYATFFTPNKQFSLGYGNKIKECYLNLEKPFIVDYDKLWDFVEAHDNGDDYFENELDIVNEFGINTPDLYFTLLGAYDFSNDTSYYDVIEAVQGEGDYDGIILYNSMMNAGIDTQIVAFNSNQIKSITNKTPSSSNNINEDLLYDEETDLPLCTSDKQELLNSLGDTLYHCTPKKNLESIYKNGLKNFWFSDTTDDLKDMVNSNYDYKYTGNELVILSFPKSKLDISKVDFMDCNDGEDEVWNGYGYYKGTINVTEENLLEEDFKSNVDLEETIHPTKLYHRTNPMDALSIIRQDTLRASNLNMFNKKRGACVCLTRDYRFAKNLFNAPCVIFVLDRDKLQHNYSLQPVSDYKNSDRLKSRKIGDSKAEEVVFKDITNLSKYIDKVVVSDTVYDKFIDNVTNKNLPYIKMSEYNIREHLQEDLSNKTYAFPNLQQAIDFFWKDRNVKIETVPIKKLVDDNNLLNDDDLQSYHQRQWDNKKASEFSIDKGKVNSMRISEVPYAVRKKDGKLELGDGRHRTRALYNDGYEYVTLPVITESKLNENKSKKHKYFAVSENDSEYYDTKANALKDLVNFGKDVEVVLYSLKNVEDIDELSSEDELGHYINGKLVKSKTTFKTTPKIKESLLQEGKQDIENFKKWIENNEDSNAQLMSAGNKDAFVNNWATEFNNIRQNLKSPYNDFYYWIKLNDWNAFTKFMQEQRNKKDAKQKEKDGAKLIYSDNDWKVYEITTYEASVKYGANTKWCISGSKRWSNGENGRGHWDDYTSKGVKFYFFIGKDTKYAIAIYPNGTDFEIFDAQDNSIAYIPNAPIIDEIKVDYYSHNEDRLMLNLIKTGQLPHICALLSSYLWKNDWDVDIYAKSEFDDFLHQLGEYINPDYVKWNAVYNGLKDEEWYEEETGEEYYDEWGGDTTYYLQNDLRFLDNYATLEDALTKDNPYFDYDNNEYFISDLYDCDIACCKDWVGVWLHIARYIEDETELINYIKRSIRDNGDYEDFEKVGLSKEYLLDIDDDYYEEDLDESLEDFDDEVGVVYHGGIEKSLHKDFKSILWFTEDYDYALDFGENIFICNLNLKNTFIVGNTDGYIRGLIPTQFSTDFTRLANNLKVTPKELLKCNPEAKNIYSIVRTKAFKELCIKNGYDSVETEEFGHVCFGVFNLDQVDIVDTDFEDESTLETLSPMDESLTPNLRDIK